MRESNHKIYSIDRLQLVYGERSPGVILHISEVPSGIACNCCCPACGTPLVARKGKRKLHHFGHASVASCSGAAETALHKLAKAIIAEGKRLCLPEYKVKVGEEIVCLHGMEEHNFDRVAVEFSGYQVFVPDLVVYRGSRELVVEILVTHACDANKVTKIKERSLAAVEINISAIARNATKDEIKAGVERTAPRHWLNNPFLERKAASFIAEHERIEQEKQIRNRRKTLDLLSIYRSLAKRNSMSDIVMYEKDDLLVRLGLDKYVGLILEGQGCFEWSAAKWQRFVISNRLIENGNTARTIEVKGLFQDLCAEGAIHENFKFLNKESEAALKSEESSFRLPCNTLRAYLDYLESVGAVSKRLGYTLSNTKIQELCHLIEKDEIKAEQMADLLHRSALVLNILPMDERTGLTPEEWLKQVLPEYDVSPAEAIAREHPCLHKIDESLDRIVKMFYHFGPILESNLGFPLSTARTRLIEQRRAEEEKRKREREEADLNAKNKRREQAESDVEYYLGADGRLWLETLSEQKGSDPLDAAAASSEGLAKFNETLRWEFENRQRRLLESQKIDELRTALRLEAVRKLGEQMSVAVLGSPFPDTQRVRLLDYCTDEKKYEKCLKIISDIAKKRRR